MPCCEQSCCEKACDVIVEAPKFGSDCEVAPGPKQASKRDIFRFEGEKPTAINLEHVTQIVVEGKRVTFQFYSTALFIDLADEVAAKNVFEVVLNVWASGTK